MSILTSGFNPSSVNSHQGFDNDPIGKGSDLLTQLEDRVSQTLTQKDNSQLGGAEQGMQAVNPQDVAGYMSQISDQPIAGTNFSSVV